jgi:alkylhydroperoxidase family enzyme
VNSAVGRSEGISEQQLHDLSRYRDSPAFTEVERLVLDLAVAMTRTPADVPEELFRSLERHFSPPQLVELTTAVAQENFRARFNRPFNVGAIGFSEGAFCPLPER